MLSVIMHGDKYVFYEKLDKCSKDDHTADPKE